MKKIIAILLAGMMTATAFAGCGGSGSQASGTSNSGSDTSTTASDLANGVADAKDFGEEDNITLKVWAPDAAVDETKKQVEAFKALYPDKTMTISVVAQGENDAAAQMLNDPSAAADVFGFPSDQLDKLVTAKVLAKCAYAPEVTAANSEESVKAGTLQDTLYCYPETTNGYYLVYDKTVVTDEQAKSFEDTLKACKDADKTFVMDAGNGYYSCIFTFTGGVTIDGFDEDGETQKFAEYDEDKAVKTLSAFANLFKEYKGTFTSLSVDNVASGFSAGTCGAGVDGTWDTASNQKALGDNFGAAQLPTINVDGEAVQMVSMFGYKYLGVNGSSKFPQSAQILAYYLAGEECQRQRATDLGWGPTNTTVSSEPVVTESQVLTAIEAQSKSAITQVSVSSTFWDPMANLGNKLIADDCKPDDTDALKTLLETTISNVRDE